METPDSLTPSIQKKFAIERLMRDYKEIVNNPLPTIIAEPLNDNIFQWHANLIGVKGSDYEGSIFHMDIVFPEDYPMSPPKVRLLTTVKRDHVFGEWICLDMLQSWQGFSQEKYTGWSTAYTCLSILLQLQAFIFESESVAATGNIFVACRNAATYQCKTCPHDMTKFNPWPYRDYMQKPLTEQETQARFNSPAFKRAYEKEQEIEKLVQQRVKNSKGGPVSEKLLQLYREEAISRMEEMQKFVEQNRKKMENRMKNEKKKVEEVKEVKKESELPGDEKKSVGKAKTIPKPVTKNDKILDVLWHTKLNPLASTFVPKSKQSTSESPQTPLPTTFEIPQNDIIGDNVFEILPYEIVYEIFEYVKDPIDMKHISKVCKLWRRILFSTYLLEKRETVCFHSKRTYQDDTLGVGITLEYHPKSGDIQYVNTKLDLMSNIAFYQEGVRKSVWQEPFTHWLPLYINRFHANYALPLLVTEIEKMYKKPFEPWLVMDLFAKLMNTMVVSVMNGSTHASIVALQGYCYFHRMLIAMVEEYPWLRELINNKVKEFVSDEYYRHKRQCPSIGDFLPLLTVSSYTWADVAVPVVKETLTRNVLWISKQHPKLATVPDAFHELEEERRAILSFKTSTTSLRLIMFHVYFLTRVAKVGKVSVADVAKGYDMRYGRPERIMESKLQKAVFSIMNVDDYIGYFEKVKLPKPSTVMIYNLLHEATNSSIKKRYHRPGFDNKPKRDVKKASKPKRNDVTDDFNSHEYY